MKNPSFDSTTGRQAVWDQMDRELRELIDPVSGRVKAELVNYVQCPICDSENYEQIFIKMGFNFVRCIDCDAIYVNPQLRDDIILDYYRGKHEFDTNARNSGALWMDVLLNTANQAWQFPYFQNALDILTPEIPDNGKILDLGCSIGLFLKIVRERGFQGIGLELEPDAVDFALSQDLDVRRQTLAEASFPKDYFDAITLFGVLEHLQHPKDELRRVWQHLRPGGAVLAIVPNVYSLAAMTLHSQSRIFNGRNHLTYFSWKSLPAIFEAAGFIVQHLDTCLTALDSVLNYWQFTDPQALLTLEQLPPRLRHLLETSEGRQKLETLLFEYDLGLRLRIIAKKPQSNGGE